MVYYLPKYILDTQVNASLIGYTWDDSNPEKNFKFEIGQNLVQKLESVGLRAKIALCIGIHEWVLGRFVGLAKNANPYQLAEAAWCANVDVHYLTYYEYDPDEYIGPIERALLYSSVNLLNVLYVSDNVYDQDDIEEKDPEYTYDFDEWKNTLISNIALLEHILPDVTQFHRWLEGVVNRLTHHYTQEPPDLFDNLFGQDNNEAILGDYVPKEVFDLGLEFDKNKDIELINNYLAVVDQCNPLLVPLEELKEYIPNPYHISG